MPEDSQTLMVLETPPSRGIPTLAQQKMTAKRLINL